MQLSFRRLTGAFRPLCVRQQSYRVPAQGSCSSPGVVPFDSLKQTTLLGWHHKFASLSSAQTAHTPDQSPEANAEASGLQDDLFRQYVKPSFKAKASRSSSASTLVLDDSQHWIKASLLPAYAWPFLTKLRLAGDEKAQADLYSQCSA